MFLGYSDSVPFLLRYSGVLSLPVISKQTVELESEHTPLKKYRTCVYSLDPDEEMNGILLIHGMSILGIEDPRLVDLAKNLTAAGYRVISPELKEMKNLRIVYSSVENIIDIIFSIHKNLKKWKLKSINFFSVSLSGGMGIIALSNELVRDKVYSSMVIGAYSDFSNVIPYVMKNFDLDSYGCFAFLYNYIVEVLDVSEAFLCILFESAIDSAVDREPLAPILLDTISKSEKDLYHKIVNEPAYRNHIGTLIQSKLNLLCIKLSPIHYLENLESKLSILHGKGDKVIPESESVQMSEKLSILKKNHKLEITGLLSHGDRIPLYRQLGDISGMLNIFGYYFFNNQSSN